ncbi:MAG: hypothetical protein D3913_09245 [Candidatus Electrothrix sp. LOE1_4_5]|jgi:hypothetical protein|nr:hypothetical protein [Candidatus Electrothrix sp. AX1]MCI5118130.1 hypothetical protein [Candidatus Electrothrix gigas]MCI5180054.1 hypothetical protein [Candidatus Electrothrix gigas]MCI5182917.1 hypothetical protein [Candidatus Electrothrix gigas]MCI5190202.1 hypothetical protein [Candidatus Electrothrix gigas]
MVTDYCSQDRSTYWSVAAFVYIIINIRVEAGFATQPERILDGSVAISLFLLMLYIGTMFFRDYGRQEEKREK